MKKIAFLDRDGVINRKAPEHQYIEKVDDFILNEGIISVLHFLQKEGYEFIVITNQRGVARGLYSLETLKKIHDHMQTILNHNNIRILGVFFCPHENNTCDCRKPKPGMLRDSCKLYELDLNESLLISDSEEDVAMGKKFGIGSNYLVTSDKPEEFLCQYKCNKSL